jgi:hypothetical protein
VELSKVPPKALISARPWDGRFGLVADMGALELTPGEQPLAIALLAGLVVKAEAVDQQSQDAESKI